MNTKLEEDGEGDTDESTQREFKLCALWVNQNNGNIVGCLVDTDDNDEIEFAEQIVRNKENIEDMDEFIKEFCENEVVMEEIPLIPKLIQRLSGSILGRSISVNSMDIERKSVSQRHRNIDVEGATSCWGLFGWLKWFRNN